MKDFKIMACMADLHIGRRRIDADSLKSQLKKHFFKVLSDMKYLDGIFILGDTTDSILSLNSAYSELFNWFFDKLYKLAKKRKCVVIVIRGTRSHDNDQLNNIKHYQINDDDVDFRVYDTVEEITIWENYKVLVLPDNNVKSKKEIDQYLEKRNQYDIILGHGTIDTMKFVSQESENMPMKPYFYDRNKLLRASKGPIFFGHIHQFQTYRDKFYYIGPFTMLERGCANAGFAVAGIYDKDRSKFTVEHYLNPDSADYFELVVSRDMMNNYPIDEIIEAVDELIDKTKENDLITLRITRGDEKDSSDKVLMLESRYGKDSRISVIKKIKTSKEEEDDRLNDEIKSRYAYIMDSNMEVSAILYKYYVEDVVPTLASDFQETHNFQKEDFERILE